LVSVQQLLGFLFFLLPRIRPSFTDAFYFCSVLQYSVSAVGRRAQK